MVPALAQEEEQIVCWRSAVAIVVVRPFRCELPTLQVFSLVVCVVFCTGGARKNHVANVGLSCGSVDVAIAVASGKVAGACVKISRAGLG